MSTYTYRFDPFNDKYARGIRLDDKKGTEESFYIKLEDNQILHYAGRQVTSLAADLMDIASIVLLVDHSSPRTKDQCRLNVKLHVRNLEIFRNPLVLRKLRSVLHHFTNDQWHFDFQQHSGDRRVAEQQMRMARFARTDGLPRVHVALFSGGLDALGGFAHQLLRHPDTFFSLVSVGTNNNSIQTTQEGLAKAIGQSPFGSRAQHVFVNTPRRYNNGFPNNPDFRVRAFAFLLIGAAYALLEGQKTLYVYENGIGAINLPFRASEVGLDHSRAVHPLSLHYMQDLISSIIHDAFRIENPFLFSTKVQVCEALQQAGLKDLILKTVTCDRIGRDDAHQCGTCSSCLLRRQALEYLHLPDTPYSMQKNNTYLCHMIYQVEMLQSILDTQNPWRLLAERYPSVIMDLDLVHRDLGLTKEELHSKVLKLYEKYVEEWFHVRHLFDREMTHGLTQLTQ